MQPRDVPLYNEVALGANAPIYAYYARQIAAKTRIVKGRCLDIGCGGGYLGLALAEISELEVVFLDPSPEMLAYANENIFRRNYSARARTLHGSVQDIPLEQDTIDLAISRGSVPFWEDLPTAFAEIHRVLAPGGQAYIGGGLGDPKTRALVEKRRKRAHPHWQDNKPRLPRHDNQHYTDALTRAGIHPFTVDRSDEGLWIRFSKEAA
nr:class I SAM-dependent methyltransferase [uncultured Desulfobulbus sp.]